jgi:hypothetical protein
MGIHDYMSVLYAPGEKSQEQLLIHYDVLEESEPGDNLLTDFVVDDLKRDLGSDLSSERRLSRGDPGLMNEMIASYRKAVKRGEKSHPLDFWRFFDNSGTINDDYLDTQILCPRDAILEVFYLISDSPEEDLSYREVLQIMYDGRQKVDVGGKRFTIKRELRYVFYDPSDWDFWLPPKEVKQPLRGDYAPENTPERHLNYSAFNALSSEVPGLETFDPDSEAEMLPVWQMGTGMAITGETPPKGGPKLLQEAKKKYGKNVQVWIRNFTPQEFYFWLACTSFPSRISSLEIGLVCGGLNLFHSDSNSEFLKTTEPKMKPIEWKGKTREEMWRWARQHLLFMGFDFGSAREFVEKHYSIFEEFVGGKEELS